MPNANRSLLAGLIGTIYEASLEQERWQDVLDNTVHAFGCFGGSVFSTDFRSRRTPFAVISGHDPAALDEYARDWMHLDPGAQAALEREEAATVASNLAVPERDYLRSDFYNGFASRIGVRYALGSLFVRSEEGAAGLMVQRHAGQLAFADEDVRHFDRLVAHLRRSFVLMRHMEEADSTRARLLSLVERTHGAVLLLDAGGRIAMASPAAERILAARDGLCTSQGWLVAADPAGAKRLDGLVLDAVRTGQTGGEAPGGGLAVRRPSGRPAYHLLVLPLVTAGLVDERPLRQVCAAVLLREGDPVPQVDGEALQALFELTPAEARVASGLAQGATPERIAAQQRINPHTVRVQLSSTYEKLGVRRQPELVQRVLTSPAALGDARQPATGDEE